MSNPASPRGTAQRRPPVARRDAVRNYHRILDAARDVLGESGADASMEEIAARAGVGVGTVYRRFASKDALIDELLRLALEEILAAVDRALARTDGHGLEELLRALGQSFADHARYASLLLQRPTEPATAPDASRDRRTDRARGSRRHRQSGHHRRRCHGAHLGTARPRRGRRRDRSRGLAAIPRHPAGGHAGGRPGQQHSAHVCPAAVQAGAAAADPSSRGRTATAAHGRPRPGGAR